MLIAETQLNSNEDLWSGQMINRMKTTHLHQNQAAFTFVELLIALVIIVVLAVLALPNLRRHTHGSPRMSCLNNLKQIGLAFRMWANDNGEQFPMSVSTNQAGSKEYNETGQVFRHFLAMTNELNTPRVLGCPTDKARTRVRTWTNGFNNQNISYFVGLDAAEKNPQMLLSGDRNIIGGLATNGNSMLFNPTSPAGWTKKIHNLAGNVGFADGSAAMFTETQLRSHFLSSANGVTRLAIP